MDILADLASFAVNVALSGGKVKARREVIRLVNYYCHHGVIELNLGQLLMNRWVKVIEDIEADRLIVDGTNIDHSTQMIQKRLGWGNEVKKALAEAERRVAI